MRSVARTLLFASLIFSPCAANAQRPDPVGDILNAGRRVYADLDYRAADSFAIVVLGTSGLRRSERIQALQLAAASRFPEIENERHPDSALVALRALVQVAPRATLPRILTWRGLDSLLEIARTTTFGVDVSARDSNEVRGLAGTVGIDVFATRPALFQVLIARRDSPNVTELVDSLGPVAQGTLRIAPAGGDTPHFPDGAYVILVTARDPTSGEVLQRRYSARFSMPNIQVRQVPDMVSPDAIKPEHARPSRVRAVVSGIVLGAFTFASTKLMRNSLLKASPSAPDSRATQWGVMLGVSTTALALYLDHGQVIASNVEYNRLARTQLAEQQRLAAAANEQARRDYRGTIWLTAEDQ